MSSRRRRPTLSADVLAEIAEYIRTSNPASTTHIGLAASRTDIQHPDRLPSCATCAHCAGLHPQQMQPLCDVLPRPAWPSSSCPRYMREPGADCRIDVQDW